MRLSSMYATVAGAVFVVMVSAACASAPGETPSPTGSPYASPGSSTSPEPSGGSESPPPVTASKVTVSIGGTYRAGANVTVTVANGLGQAIYTDDFKTECTIVILQRKDGGGWTDVEGCKLGRPTMTVSIAPGQGRTMTLDPHSFHLTSGGGGLGFGAGTYRVKFTYRMAPEVGGDDPNIVYSNDFQIS